jgi:hypothetical protein
MEGAFHFLLLIRGFKRWNLDVLEDSALRAGRLTHQ